MLWKPLVHIDKGMDTHSTKEKQDAFAGLTDSKCGHLGKTLKSFSTGTLIYPNNVRANL